MQVEDGEPAAGDVEAPSTGSSSSLGGREYRSVRFRARERLDKGSGSEKTCAMDRKILDWRQSETGETGR